MGKRTLACCLIVALAIVVAPVMVLAMDYSVTPVVKAGAMQFKEAGVSSGHQSFGSVGLDLGLHDVVVDGLDLTVGLEEWRTLQSLGPHTEVPWQGYRVHGELAYDIVLGGLTLTPYAGCEYNGWERDTGAWQAVEFFAGTAGAQLAYGRYFVRGGVIHPFDVSYGELKPRTGYEYSVGAKIIGGLSASVFHRSVQFGRTPNTELAMTGGVFSYKF